MPRTGATADNIERFRATEFDMLWAAAKADVRAAVERCQAIDIWMDTMYEGVRGSPAPDIEDIRRGRRIA